MSICLPTNQPIDIPRIMYMPTAGKPYVRFASFLRIALFFLGLGWGGVGGHVNVPCTSCIIYCHVAKISGIVCYVTCCYAAEISSVGWGWGGVGWGGMLTFLVLRALYIAILRDMLVRCWDLWDLLLRYRLLRCWDPWDFRTTWHVGTLLRSLGSFTTLHDV